MKYDASTPIAVFLGPSLDQEEARAILPANYYPPVRMGDVYRLMTCGVRLIVIIDGVFHGTAPVWQREIVAAIGNGVAVVGAGSMGALRAVELDSLGMVGHGTVYDWYRTGRIEGDDEVALLHSDAEYGYLSLSEPLVNIRHTLERATGAGVLTAAEAHGLAAAMKVLDHAERSYPALLASDVFGALPPATQSALRTFLARGTDSLKQHDARSVLAWCAASLPRLLEAQTPPRPDGRRIERTDELMLRGVPAPDGDLVLLSELVARAARNEPRARGVVRDAARRFFLCDWMRAEDVRPPEAIVERFVRDWRRQHATGDLAAWRAANAITDMELLGELGNRAAEAWLLAEGPDAFGLSSPFLEAWADSMGIEPPQPARTGTIGDWLIEHGPNYFGFDQWSPDVALARELQVSGYMTRLAAAREHGPVHQPQENVDAGAGAL